MNAAHRPARSSLYATVAAAAVVTTLLSPATAVGGSAPGAAARDRAASPAADLITEVRLPARDAGAVPIRITLSSAEARLVVRVNGEPLPSSEVPEDGRTRTIQLSADHGLRHGSNRVVVIARHHGDRDVERRTVVIRRTTPIPAAGLNQEAKIQHPVTLDATASKAVGPRSVLSYRWRLARAPRNSEAALTGARSSHPHLVPDVPGTYRLAVAVTEHPGRATARASTPGATSVDSTTVVAFVDDAGLGAPVNTLDTSGGRPAIRVGEQYLVSPDPTAALQLAVLDRTTLAPTQNLAFPGTAAGAQGVATTIAGLDGDSIVILTTPLLGASQPMPDPDGLATLNGALASIGVGPVPAAVATSAAPCDGGGNVCGGFSAIGVPGFAVGEGDLNPGLGSIGIGTAHGKPNGGSLQGYLPKDSSSGLHTFSPGDHVSFDTTAPGTTVQQAAIEVGSTTYRSETLPAPSAGIYLLVLDAGTLDLRYQATYALRYGPLDPIVAAEKELTTRLQLFVDDPAALVFVQSIGNLARWDDYEGRTDLAASWNQMSHALEQLGSNHVAVNALTNSAYAQVGPGDLGGAVFPDAPWTKISGPEITGTPGQLAGTLARNPRSQFFPDNAGGRDDPGDQLTELAYQAPVPWPVRDTKARRAAMGCVAEELGVKYPVEDQYVNKNYRNSWSSFQQTMDQLTYADLTCHRAETNPSLFTAVDLHDVVHQLDLEFGKISAIYDLVENMQQPFTSSDTNVQADIAGVSSAVTSSLPTPEGTAEVDGYAILEDVFLLIGSLPVIGEVSGGDFIASVIGLVSDASVGSDGTPSIETPQEVTPQSLGAEVSKQYEDAADNFLLVSEILVSDWGKLQTAFARAGDEWEITQSDIIDARNALRTATRRTAYESLFPLSYDGLLQLVRGETDLTDPPDASAYTCYRTSTDFQPGRGIQRYGAQTMITAAGPVPEWWVYTTADSIGESRLPSNSLVQPSYAPTLPPSDLLASMFGSGEGQARLAPLEFMLTVAPKITTRRQITHETMVDLDNRPSRNQCVAP